MAEALVMLKGADAGRVAEVLTSGCQLAVCCPATALPALAHAGTMAADLPDVLVTCPERDAPGIIAALDSATDRAASSVLAFTRHAILPGRDKVRLYFGLRRLEALSLAAFQDYWLNHHADYGRRLIPPYTYHQLHADPDATLALADACGLPPSTLDGVVEVHFPSLDALVKQLSRDDVAQGALEDERNFIDHARSQFWAYEERV
ncbi:EthD domain-containing protein [Novosphingobium album (ex Hu et al. 2023)]|uniref:EthD domain-containing protein n=1 Tax=Novosphingobium album (ex Hu et al. 2023) TaxID=2930093 RepID=A0ABT0B116_9SPHN|nr:EthD domain-containing protein [Novosphingobium album (ex Hu et al. 2023)]MCJ2178763.1 EthD domain-containing protein [Novosphingobium album (ex Hu et al. 2023)]